MAEEVGTREQTVAPELETADADNTPATVKKVELDLDDAPYLQTEEEPEPEMPEDDEAAGGGDDADTVARKRKKMLLLAGIGAAVLVIACVAVWWFFFRTPPPPSAQAPGPEVVVVPSTPADAGPRDIVREFAPFVIPVGESDGKTRFLVCKFSAITREPAVNAEMEQQILPLRDAIYYYLRSKDSGFLLDARNGGDIKKDLLSVFNDYLSQGKLEDIVFESYLSK